MDEELKQLLILLFGLIIGLVVMFGNQTMPQYGACSDDATKCQGYTPFKGEITK